MKISKKSWHYRWMKKIGFRAPNNLCSYFWTTVWSILVFPVTSIVAIVAAIVVTLPLWAWLIDSMEIQNSAILIGIFEILGLAIWLGTEISDRWEEERWANERKGIYVVKKPSIVKQYLKAKKEKVCPFLEFTNE